jgi:hypothetical protein
MYRTICACRKEHNRKVFSLLWKSKKGTEKLKILDWT